MWAAGSVSRWISQLKTGAGEAAQPLWERYFTRLVERARKRLASAPRRAADEEDAALGAFDSFCRAAEAGRFPRLNDRDDLWQLLLVLTDRKAHDLAAHERRQRRGGGQVLDEGALGGDDAAVLAHFADEGPGPDEAAQVAEGLDRLLTALDEPDLRRVAVLKMEGYTLEEIAAQ